MVPTARAPARGLGASRLCGRAVLRRLESCGGLLVHLPRVYRAPLRALALEELGALGGLEG
eukprot:4957087-Alexandrium_andersonii.AAC.1